MGVEEVEEHAHVFEAGVHALPVEGDHRVGGIAEDDAAGGVVIGRALDVDEGEVRVLRELRDQICGADEVGGDAGEAAGEEGWDGGFRAGGEGGEGGGGGEERAGEGAVERGDRDEHASAAGPDVQGVRGDGEVGGVRGRGDVEFAPEGVDVFLLVVDAGVLHQVVAGSGVGAVGADEEVEFHLDFWGALMGGIGRLGGVLGMVGFWEGAVLEPSRVFGVIGAGKLVGEEEGHVRHGFEGVEEAFVESSAVDGEDGLGGD